MFCSQCGKQVDPSSRFCANCGATISLATQPPPGYRPPNPLTRPITGRMIGGVCAAFAFQYGWDLTLTRVITALIIVCTGVGALAYIAAWVIIPEERYPVSPKSI
jgi:phage shock protein C